MKHLSMQELEDMNFKIVKSYTHDDYMTQRRQKGLMTIETTWLQSGEFTSQDLTIEEVNCIPFTKKELTALDKILSKHYD